MYKDSKLGTIPINKVNVRCPGLILLLDEMYVEYNAMVNDALHLHCLWGFVLFFYKTILVKREVNVIFNEALEGARCSSVVRAFAHGAMGSSDRSFMGWTH